MQSSIVVDDGDNCSLFKIQTAGEHGSAAGLLIAVLTKHTQEDKLRATTNNANENTTLPLGKLDLHDEVRVVFGGRRGDH